MPQTYETDVFINCPFDSEYLPIFEAIVFTVYECGFRPRCALEAEDSGAVRVEKILKIIGESRFGIHDLSRTELDSRSGLPRFNMPLELGMFLGATRFGPPLQRRKVCLVLDREQYRYQKFISDIAGQDIRSHDGNPQKTIRQVRDWLRAAGGNPMIPGGREISRRYGIFLKGLPAVCHRISLQKEELTYADLTNLIELFIKGAFRSETSDEESGSP